MAVPVPIAVPLSRQERALQTRRRILDAAVELFSQRGYESVAAGDVAERAGVAHGLVFHHFGNKRGLYLEAVREISDRLFGLPPEVPADGPPGVALRARRGILMQTTRVPGVVKSYRWPPKRRMLLGPLRSATNTLPGRVLVTRMLAHLPNWAVDGMTAPQRPNTKLSVLGAILPSR